MRPLQNELRRTRRSEPIGERLREPRWVRSPTQATYPSGRINTAADHLYAEAVELADALSLFDRARTQLVYGEWLRRHRRRIDARRYLRAALEAFEQLSAAPWADRARSELRASGESARRRDPSARDQLTPQELNIAGLAARGLTNAEIGAQLFLSPRTIDYHVRKLFAKLEIVSRADLGSVELGEPVSH